MLDKICTLVARSLRIPLLFKLLLANVVIMTLFAVVGTVIAVLHVGASSSGPPTSQHRPNGELLSTSR